jgi:plasmid stabilization system protein ParE
MHLRSIPDVPARKIAVALQMTFRSIAENPYQGAGQSELTRISGAEIRSRLVQSFRIFYIVSGIAPEIVGVLHTARDISSIMAKRLQ